jgi:hypothetical protein
MAHPVAEASEDSPFGSLTADEFYARHKVSHGFEYITNARGLRLFTQWWTPLPPTQPIGILAVVHGFTGESSWLIQLTAVFFAKPASPPAPSTTRATASPTASSLTSRHQPHQ